MESGHATIFITVGGFDGFVKLTLVLALLELQNATAKK
jgi:hypothetical protein